MPVTIYQDKDGKSRVVIVQGYDGMAQIRRINRVMEKQQPTTRVRREQG